MQDWYHFQHAGVGMQLFPTPQCYPGTRAWSNIAIKALESQRCKGLCPTPLMDIVYSKTLIIQSSRVWCSFWKAVAAIAVFLRIFSKVFDVYAAFGLFCGFGGICGKQNQAEHAYHWLETGLADKCLSVVCEVLKALCCLAIHVPSRVSFC